MKVLIGTTNPGKIQGAKEALDVFFKDADIEGIKVPSNVSDQPVNEETLQGAKNRVNNLIEYAKENNVEADYFLGVESGICNVYNTWMIVNFAVIKDNSGYESVGIGPAFPVPSSYVREIISTSLGQVLDKVYEDYKDTLTHWYYGHFHQSNMETINGVMFKLLNIGEICRHVNSDLNG